MVSRTKPLVELTTTTVLLAPFSYTDFGRCIDQPKIGNRMFFCDPVSSDINVQPDPFIMTFHNDPDPFIMTLVSKAQPEPLFAYPIEQPQWRAPESSRFGAQKLTSIFKRR